MFSKILVANRGEIACRVMETARRLGIATVAVYSAADADARHVTTADEAYAIGPAPARQSYLRGDSILAAALRSGAQAIHPGYGFLSENADFAEACAEAGVVFIGPPPAAIRAMGSKSAAKALMEAHGVPLVPGYHGDDQRTETLRDAATRIGYPVLLKASAGGGGRGMRVVDEAAGFDDALARARGEAQAAFGDDHMLVEKYLTRPRHIEVQVMGDGFGRIVSLFERDCSIQRRHQKVIEESPAPGITTAQRTALGEAAIAAAHAVAYVGAGTVEFIAEDDRFYFMEMNTRLQVEHPVTEFVTGLDLVEWQFRVAAGEPLPAAWDALAPRGHAIEARICAEDPERDFAPATGRITLLRQPSPGPHLRVDTGIAQGDTVTPFYDSMLAKLIVWGPDRADAVRRLGQALDAFALVGPRTNLDLLRRIVGHPDFSAGGVDTGFIPRHPALLAPAPPPAPAIWAAAALAALSPPREAADPFAADGWRMNGPAEARVTLRHADDETEIGVTGQPGGFWRLDLPDGPVTARLDAFEAGRLLRLEDTQARLDIVREGAALVVVHAGRNHAFTLVDRLAPPQALAGGDVRLTAPTPARVAGVFVQAGEHVVRGQKLLVLEAMKVETIFAAPRDGRVAAVHVHADELIQEGTQLVTFAPPDETAAAGA
jgi:3-methylcrotonyl-CoA carboxylase alpha subunit